VIITVYVCIGTLQHARTGLDGRPVPVEQDGPGRPVLLLVAEQLAEPFQAQG
jgi:hypothetical protein